ncbi:MAG TPA: hypothetical protein VFI42_16835 [Thermomicrobiaceae bacterium]|nr:hypothetical protein [Thermomicrobiaceae bacterium]
MTALTGTVQLVRLILRRDRIVLPLWILFLAVIPIVYVSSFNGLFPTAAERQEYAQISMHNAGFVALYGPLFGSSLGQLVAWRAGFIPVVIGLISILTVIRHTRVEEETGRRELLGSTVVGRHAGLAAALLVACGANLVLGVLMALGLIAEGLPLAGSSAFGLEMAASGWAFAGVAAVAAQLTSGAGSARALAIVTLGAAYVLRLAGDVSGIHGGGLAWLSWLSPIGWVHRLRPFAGEQWWPALLALGFTAALSLAAGFLEARRDIGAGLLPPRLGPAQASPGLRSPLALAWRLHRGLLAGWVAGFAVLGVVFGAVAKDVGSLMAENTSLQDVLARLGGSSGIIDGYLASTMSILGLIAAGYAIQAALRLRGEETSGRVEPLLSTAASRLGWAGSHLAFALLGPAAALAAAGLATGVVYGLDAGDVAGQVPRVLAGALVQLPAVWVLAGVAVVLFGLLPRFTAVSWAVLAGCLFLLLVGAAVQLDKRIMDLSPFTHIPHLPGGALSATPLVLLTLLAALLTLAGLAGLRRRDIPAA